MKAKETNTYVELITATQNISDGSALFDLFYMKINLANLFFIGWSK
jgi:hypothetical protein